MSDMPEELREVIADDATGCMVEIWRRGVCDGLERSAQMAESLAVAHTDIISPKEILVALARAIRETQLGMMMDDVTP